MYSLSPSSPPGFSRESYASRSPRSSYPHLPSSYPHLPSSFLRLPSSFPPLIVTPAPPIVIPAKAGIQGMDTGFRRYDEV